jgi:Flp pilus assembly pilin Flp
MKSMLKAMGRRLAALHKDEQGANMVEYMLIVVAVSLPLLFVVVWYWKDISMWAQGLYEKAKGGGDTDPSTIHH